MQLSAFAHSRTASHVVEEFPSWKSFVDSIQPAPTDSKLDTPAFAPAVFQSTETKAKARVVSVCLAVLDIDEATPSQVGGLLRGLGEYQHLFYTTVSHPRAPAGTVKCRVVLPLSRPVAGASWEDFWPRMVNFTGASELADWGCSDPGHIYFVPAYYDGERDQYRQRTVVEGLPLPVDEIFATAPASAPAPRLTLAALKRARPPRDYRDAHRALCAGEPYASEGERDNVTFVLVSWLYRQWPGTAPERVGELFAPSAESMGLSVSEVVYKAERAADGVGAANGASEGTGERIATAFNNGRQHPYTAEELSEFAEQQGALSVGRFKTRWLLVQDSTVHIYFDGDYRTFTRNDWWVAAQTLLAPASSAGVTFTSSEGKPLQPPEVLRRYSSAIERTYVDLCGVQNRFDNATRTYIEAPCPRRSVAPRRDPEVEKWLKLLGGGAHRDLLVWLCELENLHKPCVALIMIGPPGVGKSLLGHALARAWTTHGPCALDQALGDWTDAITRCPLVFGDEAIPKDFRGRAKTEELRAFVQAVRHPLKRKYKPDGHISGAARVLVASNNDEVLDLRGGLSPDDLSAIASRFLILKPGLEAADYLKTLPCGGSSFVEEDRLLGHVRWLKNNHRYSTKGRFLIEPDTRPLVQTLLTRSEVPGTICHALAHWLKRTDAGDMDGLYCVNGSIRVRPEAIERLWGPPVTDAKRPRRGVLSKALATLTSKRITGRGEQAYRVVEIGVLGRWCEENDFMTLTELRHRIELKQGVAECPADRPN